MPDQSVNLTRARGIKIGNWMFAYCSLTHRLSPLHVATLKGSKVRGPVLVLRRQLYIFMSLTLVGVPSTVYSKVYLNLFT